jgi:hypothetical protein
MSRKAQAPSLPPGVAAAVAYCRDVLSGQIAVCRLVHLTCERFLRDLAAAQAGQGLWEFRSELAERAMIFAGLLPNIRGPEAGKPLRLMAWQRLVFANLFGFVERSTGARRFRQGIVFVPRGNGKTSIAAPLALYLSFMDGEGGAEGYAAAVTRDQARITVRYRPPDGPPLSRDSPPLWRRGAGEFGLARTHEFAFSARQLRRQSPGWPERAGGGVRRDRFPPHIRGLRRSVDRDGQTAEPFAAVHFNG